jgi:hypothetical protein
MHERITLTVYIRVQKFVLSRQIGQINAIVIYNTSVEPTIKKMSQINYIGRKVISNISQNII